MPCNCDGYEPEVIDVTAHQALCVLRELGGGDLKPKDWHPHSRSPDRGQADEIVAEACRRLRGVDVTKYSLELQMWWRDHQEADKRREAQAKKKAEEAALRESALAKLTPKERKALGLRG